jgi:hypothetical protein
MGVGAVAAGHGAHVHAGGSGGAKGAPDPAQLSAKATDSDPGQGVAQLGNGGCSCGGGGPKDALAGAKGGPDAPPRSAPGEDKGGGGGAPTQSPSSYADPSKASASPEQQPGETSYDGLKEKAKQVLSAAHGAGLKLISGLRAGESQGHGDGSAVDVSNVPGGSKQGSPEMKQFAEAMRAAGKAGDPTIGYVIYQQQIASARDNWAWRPMEDRGSNTQNHFDHVHVSTDPNR